jgi:hypothetical protein
MYHKYAHALVLIIVLIFSPGAYAQILNIEKHRTSGDSIPYAFNLTGSLSANNRSAAENNPVNLFGYNFSLSSIFVPGKHAYIFLAKRNFLKINENPFLNFGFIHARVNFFRKKRLNYELFLQHSDDNFRGLNPRIIAGGSLRLNIIDLKNVDLIVGQGAFFEQEDWAHPANGELNRIQIPKSSTYLVWRHTFSKLLSINTVSYFQTGYDPSVAAFRNRFNSNIVLNTKISKFFSLVNRFECSYEDRPIVPITKFIYGFSVGVGVDI